MTVGFDAAFIYTKTPGIFHVQTNSTDKKEKQLISTSRNADHQVAIHMHINAFTSIN